MKFVIFFLNSIIGLIKICFFTIALIVLSVSLGATLTFASEGFLAITKEVSFISNNETIVRNLIQYSIFIPGGIYTGNRLVKFSEFIGLTKPKIDPFGLR